MANCPRKQLATETSQKSSVSLVEELDVSPELHVIVLQKAGVLGRLKQFEGVLTKAGVKGAFVSGDLPLWGDSALFSLISDNIATGYIEADAVKEAFAAIRRCFQ